MARSRVAFVLLLLCMAMAVAMADLATDAKANAEGAFEEAKGAASKWADWAKDKLSGIMNQEEQNRGEVAEKAKVSLGIAQTRDTVVDAAEKAYMDAKVRLEAAHDTDGDEVTYSAEKAFKDAKGKVGDGYAKNLESGVKGKLDKAKDQAANVAKEALEDAKEKLGDKKGGKGKDCNEDGEKKKKKKHHHDHGHSYLIR